MRQSYFTSVIFLWFIGIFLFETVQSDCGPRLYVKANAPSGGDGTSWATAFNKLQDAISQANSCAGISEIWVAQGTYYPDEGGGKTDNDRSASFTMRNNLSIYGGFFGNETQLSQRILTNNETILSGDIDQNDEPGFINVNNNSYHLVLNNENGLTNTAILDGFTIASGLANFDDGTSTAGAGILNRNASPAINNCKFTNNLATFGAAITNLNASSVLITNCVFEYNQAARGGTITNILATVTIKGCRFTNNIATGISGSIVGGGAIDNDTAHATILNCRFTNNLSGVGGAIMNQHSSTSTITNSVFVENNVTGYGGAIFNYIRSRSSMVNCTFYKNTAVVAGNSVFNGSVSSCNAVNSIFWGNFLQIQRDADSEDTVNYSIVQRSIVYPGTGNLNTDPLFADPVTGDLQLTLNSPGLHKGNDAANNELTDIAGNPRKRFQIDMGAYELQVECPDNTILYVKKNPNGPNGLNDGTSWANAFSNLQDALAALSDICPTVKEIWVAKGTYYPDEGGGKTDNDKTAYFSMKNNVAIYGGFAGNETSFEQRNWKTNKTILSGDIDQNDNLNVTILGLETDPTRENNSNNVIKNLFADDNRLTNSARIDGFTITGGHSGSGAGISNTYASPTIVNCNFTSNYGFSGGALFNLYFSSPQVINCVFNFNLCGNSGGAILSAWDCSPSFINSTIVNNSNKFANGHSITNQNNATTTLTNCIIWANPSGSSSAGFDMFSINSNTITYSVVKGGFIGQGNSNLDPLFVDGATNDYHLQQQSPAVNSGNNAANNETLDLDANPRKVGTIDMGAYETIPECESPGEWVIDIDNDNYYSGTHVVSCTSPGQGYVLKGEKQPGDCNDNNNTIYPGAPEICDELDNDCDGETDEGFPVNKYYYDLDSDGYGDLHVFRFSCAPPEHYVENFSDCAPSDPTKFRTTLLYVDNDGDGYTVGQASWMCVGEGVPAGYSYGTKGPDCNDNDASLPKIYYGDQDGDGFRTGPVLSCEPTPPAGWYTTGSETIDCNDSDPTVHSYKLYWPDADGDGFGYDPRNDPTINRNCWNIVITGTYASVVFIGYGDFSCDDTEPRMPRFFCAATPPPGWALNGDDCNDFDVTIHPGANDIEDGKDNDCDGEIDECTLSLISTVISPLKMSGCGTANIISQTFAYATTLVSLTAVQYSTIAFAIAESSCALSSVSYVDVIDQQSSSPGNLVVVRTFTLTDVAGNTATVTQSITVEDKTAPVFTTDLTTVSLGCNPNVGSITAALGFATATDACGTTTVTSSDGAITGSCTKTQTRTFTATDAGGNTSTVARTVTWTVDVTPPTFTGSYADVNLGCNPANPNGSLGTATATDVCGAVTITSQDGSVVSYGCNRSITRSFAATDGCNNKSTTSRIVRWISDLTPPSFTGSYADVNLGCNPVNPDGSLGSATATDGCGAVTITSSDGAVISNGCNRSRTRTFTATDGCLNTSTTSRTVRWIADITPPSFTGYYSDVNLTCNPANPDGSLGTATATDVCGTVTITSYDGAVVSNGCNRSRTRTFTAKDGCLNSSTTSRTVRWIYDVTAPTLTPGGTTFTLEWNPNASDINAALGAATATDACGAATVSSSDGSVTGDCLKSQTRTFTAKDACGNTSTVSRTVTWKYDKTPPVITNALPSMCILAPANHKMRDVVINYSLTDNCGGTISSILSVSSDEPISGTGDGDAAPDWEVINNQNVRLRAERSGSGDGRVYTITITATDAGGNTSTSSVEVRVTHNITSPQSGKSFKVGSTVSLEGEFWDKQGNNHSATWLIDDNTTVKGTVTEPTATKNGKVTGSYKFTAPGVYKLQMNTKDQNNVVSYANTSGDLEAIIVIYDPNGGYTYGGGYFNSPAGAVTSNASVAGKASYGFSVNYFKGATYPKGETQFDFKVGEFEFNALNFEYMAIAGAKAQMKGTGKIIGGQSGINFILTVTDGQLDGTGIDKIRMKIYNKNTMEVYYDNQPGASDVANPTIPVQENSTVVISDTNSNLTQSNQVTTKVEQEVAPVADGLEVKVMPNPSSTNFRIVVNSNDLKSPVKLLVTDMLGRVMETRITNAEQTITIGDKYISGTYAVRILQGRKIKQLELIKLSD
ncbi:MAG TPA: MopE-related protein [Chitinophagaceae bacterium]|nr:MopE-related protein [Chitinophagaceae bacterium]